MFNNKDDFCFEADVDKVATKAWNWILNPITLEEFMNDIVGKKVLVVQRSEQTESFTYDQEDPEDNLLSLQMVKDFVKFNDGQLSY